MSKYMSKVEQILRKHFAANHPVKCGCEICKHNGAIMNSIDEISDAIKDIDLDGFNYERKKAISDVLDLFI